MNLSETTLDVLERIEQAEQKKEYHKHLDEVNVDDFYAVDKHYSYEKSWYLRVGYFIIRQILIFPYSYIANQFWLKTEIRGRENLKYISTGAVVCSNHVNKLDVLAIQRALEGIHVHYTVAEFNNRKSRLGTYMRAFGIMPIPSSLDGKRNFDLAIKSFLEKKHFIAFFPESAEWWCYEKPRPLQMGAYHYAAKNNVPILPIFITFKKLGKFNEQGIEQRKFIVNILKPIFPLKNVSLKENKLSMHRENEYCFKKCYEDFYHKKLI